MCYCTQKEELNCHLAGFSFYFELDLALYYERARLQRRKVCDEELLATGKWSYNSPKKRGRKSHFFIGMIEKEKITLEHLRMEVIQLNKLRTYKKQYQDHMQKLRYCSRRTHNHPSLTSGRSESVEPKQEKELQKIQNSVMEIKAALKDKLLKQEA